MKRLAIILCVCVMALSMSTNSLARNYNYDENDYDDEYSDDYEDEYSDDYEDEYSDDYEDEYSDDYEDEEDDYDDEEEEKWKAIEEEHNRIFHDHRPYFDENDNIICDENKLEYYGRYQNAGISTQEEAIYGLCNDGVHDFVELSNAKGGRTVIYDIFQFSEGLEEKSKSWYAGQRYFAWIEGIDLHSMKEQFDPSVMENRENQIQGLIGNRPAIIMESRTSWNMNGDYDYMNVWCYNLVGFEQWSVTPMTVAKKYSPGSAGFPKHDYPGSTVQTGPLVDTGRGCFAVRAAGTYAYKYNENTTYYCYLGFFADDGRPFIKHERKDNDVIVGSTIKMIGEGLSSVDPTTNLMEVYLIPNDNSGVHKLYGLGEDRLKLSNIEIINGQYQTISTGIDYNCWVPGEYKKISNDYPAENFNVESGNFAR